MELQHVIHPFAPVYDDTSEILILGTLPSVKSRENQFYYGHKQNRFWKLLAMLYHAEVPESIETKKELLYKSHVAVWDVVYACDIRGSGDSSIKNVEPTDIRKILSDAPIRQIYANGKKAGMLYEKYQKSLTGREIVILPSTSPANAVWTMDKLFAAWQVILS